MGVNPSDEDFDDERAVLVADEGALREEEEVITVVSPSNFLFFKGTVLERLSTSAAAADEDDADPDLDELGAARFKSAFTLPRREASELESKDDSGMMEKMRNQSTRQSINQSINQEVI